MTLSQAAELDLKKSGLDRATINNMQIFEVEKDQQKKWLKDNGFATVVEGEEVQIMYVIPLPTGGYRVKLLEAIGNNKYLSQKGEYLKKKKISRGLYYMDGEEDRFGKVKTEVIITEGEKKTAKTHLAAKEKYCVVGAYGISMWNTPTLESMTKNGRRFYIAFDNGKRNPGEEKQKMALFLYLYKKKAIPIFLKFPAEKIDDWLAAVPNDDVALESAVGECVNNRNIFDNIEEFDAEYMTMKMAEFGYEKTDIYVFWEMMEGKKRTGINKTTIKDMVVNHRVRNMRKENKRNDKNWILVDERGRCEVITGVMAKELVKKYGDGDGLIYHQSSFWSYERKTGIWVEEHEGGNRVRKYIQDQIGADLSRKSLVEDVFFQMKNESTPYERDFEFNKNSQLLNLKNGVLDLEKMELSNHKKEHYFTSRISAKYNPGAKCPKWDKFLVETELDNATIQRLQEWFGYCLIPCARLEKALFLKGEAGTGKSVIIVTLENLLEEYRSAIDPTEIFNRFNTVQLRGKLVNICTDVNTTAQIEDRIKKVISGESMNVEYKGRDGFTFKPHAKLVFSANDFIPTKDKSDGVFRRFDVITMDKKWPEDLRNESLKDEIRDEELDGVLLWAIEGLKRLKKNNWKMTSSEEMKESLNQFKVASNPLLQFMQECCEVDENSVDSEVLCADLYENYKNWCSATGHKSYSASKMGRETKRLYPEIEKKRKSKNQDPKRPNFYKGIKVLFEYYYDEGEKRYVCSTTGEASTEQLQEIEREANKKTEEEQAPVVQIKTATKQPKAATKRVDPNLDKYFDKNYDIEIGEKDTRNGLVFIRLFHDFSEFEKKFVKESEVYIEAERAFVDHMNANKPTIETWKKTAKKTVATKEMIEDAATREHALFDEEYNHFEDETGA